MATTQKTVTFGIALDDQTSGPASAAAASLSNLKDKIDGDVKSLREMQKALRNMKGGTSTASAAFKTLRDRVAAQKATVATAQSKYVELGGTFGKTAAQATKAGGGISKLGSALAGANGPLGAMVGSVGKLGSLLANPVAATVALAAAFVALGAAIGTATIALLKWGITASDARRTEALQIEGLNTIRRQWGFAAASVGEFQAAMDRASDSTNVSRSTLQGYARSLSRAGLRGEALTEAVEAMGLAAQVQGERGANRFRALAFQARLTGGSVTDLAESYRNRLGPIARRQMLEIGNQTERARRSLERIFSGLRTEPFLNALDGVLSLLSQSTASGRALKTIFKTLFQPLVDQSEAIGPIVKRFFQGMIIGGLLLTLAFLRVRNALRRTFGGSELFDNLDLMNVALNVGTAAVVLFGAAIVGTAAVGIAAMAAMATVMAGVFNFVFGFPVRVALMVSSIVDLFEAVDMRALASSMIDGLVAGITAGAARVSRSMGELGATAADAFRSVLGIASPSKVFAGYGLNIAQGTAQGVDAGSPVVSESVGSLVDVPTGGGSLGGGGRTSITIGDISINASDGATARDLAVSFRDELATILEGVSIELGVGTA